MSPNRLDSLEALARHFFTHLDARPWLSKGKRLQGYVEPISLR